MKKIACALALCLLALPASAQEDVPPGGAFTATATMTTSQGTRSMAVTIVVTNPVSPAQAAPLKKVLDEGGQQALLAAIRGGGRGQIRFGALETPIDLVIAEKTRDGFRYVAVMARALRYEETNLGSPSVDYPFAIAIFEVNDFSTGDGQIFPQAALGVDADGRVQAAQYNGDPGTLDDVKSVDPL
jgi:hypothetical protein